MKSFLPPFILLVLSAVTPVSADDRATQDKARAMTFEAAAFLSANDPEIAFRAFNDDPAWKDRDLYVYAFENTGVMRAHGTIPTLIGLDLGDLRDIDGQLITWDIPAVESERWVE